jgi:hypothetical protein
VSDLLRDIAAILGDPDGSALVRSVREEAALELLDFSPRCDAVVNKVRCGRAAEFSGHCKSGNCEATIGLICGICLDAAATQRWTCTTCGARGWFRDIHALTPLGGA